MDKKILLVEDDESLRELYRLELEKVGFKVSVAGDIHKASSLLPEIQPDLILLDIMLPRDGGLGFLKTIKGSEQTKEIPVILLTGLAKDPIVKEAFELGAAGYLVKVSYTPSQVVEEVKKFFGKK